MVEKFNQQKKPLQKSAANRPKSKDDLSKISDFQSDKDEKQSTKSTTRPLTSPVLSPKLNAQLKPSKLSLRTPTPSPSPRYYTCRTPKSHVQIIVQSDNSDDSDAGVNDDQNLNGSDDKLDVDVNGSNSNLKVHSYHFLKPNQNADDDDDTDEENELNSIKSKIPEVLRHQGSDSFCSSNPESNCPCNTFEDVGQISKKIAYCNRKTWISVERMHSLRKRAQEALKHHKTFTIRGCFFSIRNALTSRGWVEKLDVHRKHVPNGVCQITYEDLAQTLPKRKPGESRRQYLIKCERNIMSRFLEHMPIDFLWTARKEKCDYIDQAKNPSMIINKFQRIPFTSKEGLCNALKDFHWFYEEGISELYFPRCFNTWSPEELSEFIDNFRLSACIAFVRWISDKYRQNGFDAIFSPTGKIPFTAIDFAVKRCTEFLEISNHNDIDNDENVRIWEHDFDAFLTQHYLMTQDNGRILADVNRLVDPTIKTLDQILFNIQDFCPQFNLDGYLNLWIIKPANKCRGRGIHIFDNLKKILNMVNPNIASKSRFVVQKYIEKPLIIHSTKFDIRQWFMVTSTQPMVVWMYKECYLRFSSQEYNLNNHHESVHLTNHAIQKKYKNGKRDKRLPSENMWDCYSFQAYLRQIGKHMMWSERIYPGMKKAIIGTMLASQESMDRRSNTFELFGADFMISEDFHPWLIEINSSPDLGATTSVTARMCPQCLEDVIKVVIDRRYDIKADTGNFECIYRQMIPPTPAYMGLNLFLKGKQIVQKTHHVNRHRERPIMSGLYSARKSMPSVHLLGSLNSIHDKISRSSESNLNELGTNSSRNELGNDDDIKNTTKTKTSLVKKNGFSFFRKSAINTLTMLDFNSIENTANNNRRLTPLATPQSSRRSSTQLIISPRCSNLGDAKPSNEIRQTIIETNGGKPKVQYIPKSKLQNTFSKRHFSCGPRISSYGGNDQQENLIVKPQKQQLDNNKENNLGDAGFDGSLECIGSKCSMENLNLLESEENSRAVTPSRADNSRAVTPRILTPNRRKQIYDALCKPRPTRVKKIKPIAKRKSSPASGNSSVVIRRKSNVLNRKSTVKHHEKSTVVAIKSSKENKNVKNFPVLNIKTWCTKKEVKDEIITKGKSASPFKCAPTINPIRRKSDENVTNRRCLTCIKKPSSNKNSTVKGSQDPSDRINTRC